MNLNNLLAQKRDLYNFIKIDRTSEKDKTTLSKFESLQLARGMEIMSFNGIYSFKHVVKGKWVQFADMGTLLNYVKANDYKVFNGNIQTAVDYIYVWLVDGKFNLEFNKPDNIFLFKNGYIDIAADVPVLHSYNLNNLFDEFPIQVIPFDYRVEVDSFIKDSINPYAAQTQKLFTWLSKGNEQEYINILTMLGITMNNIPVEYYFNLYGEEHSGKSSLLDIARQFVDVNKQYNVDFNELGERFGLGPLVGKSLIYNDDIDPKKLSEKVMKQLTKTGALHALEYKGQNMRPMVKLPVNIIFCSNERVMYSSTKGTGRRHKVFTFPYNTRIDYNLPFIPLTKQEFSSIAGFESGTYKKEFMEGLIPKIIHYMEKWFKNYKEWIKSSIEEEEFKELMSLNDNVLEFANHLNLISRISKITVESEWETILSDKWKKGEKWLYTDKKRFYNEYDEFSKENGTYPKKTINFYADIERAYLSKGIKVNKDYVADKSRNFAIDLKDIMKIAIIKKVGTNG